MVSMVLTGDRSGPMRWRFCWHLNHTKVTAPKKKKLPFFSVSSSGLDLLSVLASEFHNFSRTQAMVRCRHMGCSLI